MLIQNDIRALQLFKKKPTVVTFGKFNYFNTNPSTKVNFGIFINLKVKVISIFNMGLA